MFSTLRLLLVLTFSPTNLIKCEANWTYDLVAVDVENKTPNIVFIEAEVTRPRRGVLALSGILELKEDITDQIRIRLSTFYSLSGSNFLLTPFGIAEANLSTVMNNYYKEFVMESILNCSDNAPQIVNEFVAPLTKRVVHLRDCVISNKDLTPMLRSGYYKINIWYSNCGEGSVEFLVKVEKN